MYEESVDTILGIFKRAGLPAGPQRRGKTSLKDPLRPAYFVPETMKADNLFKEMQKEKVHIAVVVDEYGGTEGNQPPWEDLLGGDCGQHLRRVRQGRAAGGWALGENQWRIAGSTPISTLVDDLELPPPAGKRRL